LNSAFKKYDPKESADQQTTQQNGDEKSSGVLRKGTSGEPSFGGNSKNNRS